MDRSLATVREAHQKVLTTAAALKEEIERLSCPLPQSWAAVWVRSKSRDCWPHESMKCKKRCCHVQFSEVHTMPQLV